MKMADQLNKGSRRHHFVPEYFITGFSKGQGRFHVYDKKADRFQTRLKSPSQLCFEFDHNTSSFGGRRTDLPEQAFSFYDNLIGPEISRIRNRSRDDLTEEDGALLLYFLVTQYLRCPVNDDRYRQVHEALALLRPDPISSDPLIQRLAASDLFQKLDRSGAPTQLVRSILQAHPGPYPISLFDYKLDTFVLTDNPVVYIKQPVKPEDYWGDCTLALTDRRLLMHGDQLRNLNPLALAISHNSAQIEQADRLVMSRSKVVLERAVNAWKEATHRIE